MDCERLLPSDPECGHRYQGPRSPIPQILPKLGVEHSGAFLPKRESPAPTRTSPRNPAMVSAFAVDLPRSARCGAVRSRWPEAMRRPPGPLRRTISTSCSSTTRSNRLARFPLSHKRTSHSCTGCLYGITRRLASRSANFDRMCHMGDGKAMATNRTTINVSLPPGTRCLPPEPRQIRPLSNSE